MEGIKVNGLSVGYNKKVLIGDIEFTVSGGEIVTLIGPNGCGKSTLLKTITRQLAPIDGSVSLVGKDLIKLSEKEVSQILSMVMTDRIHPEYMTCRDVVSTGRYPYTGNLGILSKEDKIKVEEALALVHSLDIAGCDFNQISDGQKQRIMLARAICQEPRILVLDEPTSFLDIYYKLDILKSVSRLAKEKQIAVIMSLHELDLARQVSDKILCVERDKIKHMGTPEEIFQGDLIQNLFGVGKDCFDPKTGMIYLDTSESNLNNKATFVPSKNEGEKVENRTLEIEQTDVFKTEKRDSKTKVIMVQGTMSNAGKSLLVAGLCRVFKQDGYRVAPFKSQNMALNSFITKEGLEMGRAQVMQAEAAGIEPLVCMNPILLKPTSNVGSQVILNGEVLQNMTAKDYFKYKKNLVPEIMKAYHKLEEMADIIVIEGAGSPAEINLKENDIVNMGMAQMVDAPVLLVGDIDRGGVFAQLIGTLMLLEKEEKDRIKGLVINKFRGDKSILDPGIKMLEEKGEIPVVGVLPYMNISVDDEDSLSPRLNQSTLENEEQSFIRIAVVKLPHISNFTDFTTFERMKGVTVCYVTKPSEIANADMVILPGSKNTIGDLKWLRECGLEAAIKQYSANNPVWGICGGYQMLGREISDPEGVEEGGSIRGMELLSMNTVLGAKKSTLQVKGHFAKVSGILSKLSDLEFEGYEIHMGQSSGENSTMLCMESENGKDTSSVRTEGAFTGNVYGSYVHGIFDQTEVAYAIAQTLADRKGVALEPADQMSLKAFKESQYDKLADYVREYMDMDAIYKILGLN